MPVMLNVIKILTVLVSISLHANILQNIDKSHPYLFSEGIIDKKNDNSFQELLNDKFYTSGTISLEKLKDLNEWSKELYDQHTHHAFMSEKLRWIELYRYQTDEDGVKKAAKRLKNNKTYLYAIERFKKDTTKLIENFQSFTNKQIQEKVNYLALLYSLIQHPQEDSIFKSNLWTARKLLKGFYKIRPDKQKSALATNLLRPDKQEFYTQTELKKLLRQGEDLSLLDPPSSPFWQKTDISKYDAFNETFNGKDIFPKEDIPTLHYKRMGTGQIKMKIFFLDEDDDKKEVTIKLGRENYAALISSKLARSVGLPSLPLTYRKRVKLKLPKETSYDNFIASWEKFHEGFGVLAPDSYIEGYDQETKIVTLKDVMLEAYPGWEKNYYKLGSYRSGQMGLNNRRDYRALLVYAALIGWSDAREKNIRVDIYREKKGRPWKLLYMLNDTGQSMGSWFSDSNPAAVNNYFSKIAREKLIGKAIWLLYLENEQHPDTWRNVLHSDAKWIIRQFAKLSPKQILDITVSSGLNLPVAELYAQKIIRRINNLIKIFKLDKATQKVALLKETSFEDLSNRYKKPDNEIIISDEGRLLPAADKDHDNALWYRGSNADLLEMVSLEGFNMLQNAVSSSIENNPDMFGLDNISYKKTSIDFMGLRFWPTRNIKVNHLHGNRQNRYLVEDTFILRIPIGLLYETDTKHKITYTLPIGHFREFKFTHYHSHTTKTEALTSKFFKSMIPWKLNQLKENLGIGEQLAISKNQGISYGGLDIEIENRLKAQISPYQVTKTTKEMTYITRLDEHKFDVVTIDEKNKINNTGIHLEAYLKIIYMNEQQKGHRDYVLYQFDNSIDSHQNAYFDLVINNSNKTALQNNIDSRIVEDFEKKSKKRAFMIWSKNLEQSFNDINIEIIGENNQDGENSQILKATYTSSKGKDLRGLWSGPVFNPAAQGFLSYFGKSLKEDIIHHVSAIGDIGQDGQFSDLELTIDLISIDNWQTRKEFEKHFIKRFSDIYNSGKEKTIPYFNYKMDQDIDHFSPAVGRMHVQLGKKGIQQFLNKLPSTNWCLARCKELVSNIKKLQLNTTEKIKKLVELAYFTTRKLNNIGKIRDLVDQDNMWHIAYIDNALASTIPLAMDKNFYIFAVEHGEFQGHNKLEKLDYNHSFRPEFLRFPLVDTLILGETAFDSVINIKY